MADSFWTKDQVVTPSGAAGPSPPPGYDLVPLTGTDPKKEADAEKARLELIEKRRALGLNDDGTPIVATGASVVSGQDFLKTLPDKDARMARAIAEGRVDLPKGRQASDPNWMRWTEQAMQYDPELDQSNVTSRRSTRRDFTSGSNAKNITAINTALGHLDSLAKATDELDNFGDLGPMTGVANRIRYKILEESGDPRTAKFKQSRDAVANELMRVFRQVGASTTEIKEWQDNISSSQSPDQFKASIQTAAELLGSRLSAMNDSYQRGMGASSDVFELLSPHAREIFSRYGIGPGNPASDDGGDDKAGIGAAGDPGGTPPGGGDQGPPPVSLNLDPNGNVILQDKSTGVVEGGDTGIIGEEGGTHTEANPALAGANATVNTMLKANHPLSEIAAYLKGKGADDATLAGIMRQAMTIKNWQKENPGFHGDFNVDIERSSVPNSAWQNFANSDVGAAAGAGTDALAGFNIDSLAGALGRDPEEVRKAMAAVRAAHPKSATAGTIIGGVVAALGAEEAAAKAGLTGITRTTAADLAFGGSAGAGATDYGEDGAPATIGDRLEGGLKGAAAAGVGGAVGTGVTRAARLAPDPYVATVNAERIPTTVGQQYGQGRLGSIVKRTEDRIAGLPIIGDIINARRVEGIKKFNERAFDRTLEPIGVKSGGKIAEEGIDFAQNKISEAFDKALKGKTVAADVDFANELGTAFAGAKALPRVGEEVADNIKTILEPYMTGSTVSGEAMQQMSRELRDLKAGYFADPMKKRIGQAIDATEESIFGMFRRQAPEVLPDYNKAKVAQRRLYTLADAVNAAKNKEGIFMPSQLGTADRKATIKTEGKVSAARGRGQFQELQRAGQKVLPSEIPDSGTAGRIIIPGIALGIGGGSDAAGLTDGAGTTLAGILALAYTKSGQRLLTKPGRGVGGRVGKFLTNEQVQKALTAGGASTGVALATQ